jgi:hypothetical protein
MSDARVSALLFLAALLTRILSGLGSALFGTDSAHYLIMADWMREGRFHDALSTTYHPMYPLLIAVARSFCGSTPHAGQAVSVLLGSAATVPLVSTVRTVFGRPAAFITGLIYAFGMTIFEVQSDVMTEGTYFFFFFTSVALTLKMAEDPTVVRAVVLGLSAAAAFLTRPEGLLPIVLALVWPAVFFVRHRKSPVILFAAVVVTVATIVLALSPYLLWVKSVRGHWALSARASAMSGEMAVGITDQPAAESGEEMPQGQAYYYRLYLKSLFRLTGVLIPFYLIGLASLRFPDRLRAALYFSFPLGQMIGVLVTLRTHNFMTERYIMAGMTMMSVVAAQGMLRAWAWAAGRWSWAAARPAVGAALIAAITVVPGVRCLKLRRQDCLSYPVAASWILEQHWPRLRGMSGPVEQVAYLCGVRSYYSAGSPEGLRRQIQESPVDCYVYSQKDVESRSMYVRMLQSSPYLMPPESIAGPPGTVTVFVQRVK